MTKRILTRERFEQRELRLQVKARRGPSTHVVHHPEVRKGGARKGGARRGARFARDSHPDRMLALHGFNRQLQGS
jgi:general stress protein YciG